MYFKIQRLEMLTQDLLTLKKKWHIWFDVSKKGERSDQEHKEEKKRMRGEEKEERKKRELAAS